MSHSEDDYVSRHDQEQAELFALDHKPMRPPRKGHEGEQVYASIWEATMTPSVDSSGDDEIPIQSVLRHFKRYPNQRDATICATVACWLGTNIGNALLHEAKRLATSLRDFRAYHAYLIAWTLENSRSGGVNHGVRTVEYLLAPPELWKQRAGWLDCGLKELPELSADDLEVIEHFMSWLGDQEGQKFLKRCEARIAALRHEKALLDQAELARIRNEREAAA